jgi:hypothetical protein
LPEDDEDTESEEEDEGGKVGSVYMMTAGGSLKLLEKGTDQYVRIIERM